MNALSDKLAAGVGADGEGEDAPVYFRKLTLGAHVHPNGRGGKMLGIQQYADRAAALSEIGLHLCIRGLFH